MKKDQRKEQSTAALAKSHLAFVLALALATVATGSAAQLFIHVTSSTIRFLKKKKKRHILKNVLSVLNYDSVVVVVE